MAGALLDYEGTPYNFLVSQFIYSWLLHDRLSLLLAVTIMHFSVKIAIDHHLHKVQVQLASLMYRKFY